MDLWRFINDYNNNNNNNNIINTKLPSCDDIIHRTSLGFPSWRPESTRPTLVLPGHHL